MRNALRELLGDAWVLPIASAAAIAYATVVFLQNFIDVLIDLIVRSQVAQLSQAEAGYGQLFDEPMRLRIGNRVIFLQPLLESVIVLVVVLAAAAFVLRWTTRERPVDVDA